MGFASILDSLGWAIMHSLWQGTLAAFAVIAFRALTKDSQASLRCGFQLIALFAMLVAFIGTFLFYQFQYLGPSVSSSFEMLTVIGDSGGALPAINDSVAADIKPSSLLPAIWQDYISWLGSLWIIGFVLLSLKYSVALYMTQQLRHVGLRSVPGEWSRRFRVLVLNSGISRQVAFHISDKVNGPMTLGFFKPIVLVPASFFSGLPSDQIEAILLHEIAHIRRHDYMINLIQTAVRVVFFYHPAAHFIAAKIDDDRERACDDFTVRVTDNPDALVKGLAALRLSLMPRPFAMSAADRKSPLVARMKRLITPESSSRRPEHVVTSMVAMIAAASLYTLYSPLANAHPELNSTQDFSSVHPKADMKDLTFKTVNENGWSYTVKVADDGSEWVLLDGSWHNVDKKPELLKRLPKAPVPPVMPDPEKIQSYEKFKSKAAQYEIDLGYYIAWLEGQKWSGKGNVKDIQSKLDVAKTQKELLKDPNFNYDVNFIKPVAAPAAPVLPLPTLAGEPQAPTPGLYINGKRMDDAKSEVIAREFGQNIAKIESQYIAGKITMEEAEKARSKAEKKLDRKMAELHMNLKAINVRENTEAWEDKVEAIAEKYEDQMDAIEDRLDVILDEYDAELDKIEHKFDDRAVDETAIRSALNQAEKDLKRAIKKIEFDRETLHGKFGEEFNTLMQETTKASLQRELKQAEKEVKQALDQVKREQTFVMSDAKRQESDILRNMRDAQREAESQARMIQKQNSNQFESKSNMSDIETTIKKLQKDRAMMEKANEEAFHVKADFKEFRDITLLQLKNDGLISKSAKSATLKYKNDKLYVNGSMVSAGLMDKYCDINENYHIHKGANAEIKITQNYIKMKDSVFKYGSTKTSEWTFK